MTHHAGAESWHRHSNPSRVALDDRFELFGFQGGAQDDEYLQTSMSAFQDQVMPFSEQLTVVSAGAATLLPKPETGELDWVW